MAKWLQALSKTRSAFSGATRALFGQSKAELDEVDLEELEEALIKADVSPRLAGEWISKLDKKARRHSEGRSGALRDLLIESLQDDRAFSWDTLATPTTVLLLGINGAGKTTVFYNHRTHGWIRPSQPFFLPRKLQRPLHKTQVFRVRFHGLTPLGSPGFRARRQRRLRLQKAPGPRLVPPDQQTKWEHPIRASPKREIRPWSCRLAWSPPRP